MADKVTLKQLRQFIPDLTKYRFSTARQHRIIHGRGTPLVRLTGRRMIVSLAKLDHFLTFITSPDMVQDMPFREKFKVVYWRADQDAKRHTPYDF